jgi:hypothetical protein
MIFCICMSLSHEIDLWTDFGSIVAILDHWKYQGPKSPRSRVADSCTRGHLYRAQVLPAKRKALSIVRNTLSVHYSFST